jgi:hypothetical protein
MSGESSTSAARNTVIDLGESERIGVVDASGAPSTPAPASLPPAVQKLVEERREKTIALVARHTEYSRETIIEKLESNGGDYQAVIAEFIGVGRRAERTEVPASKSLLQRKYGEIRRMMDDASNRYYSKKSAEEEAAAYAAVKEFAEKSNGDASNVDTRP